MVRNEFRPSTGRSNLQRRHGVYRGGWLRHPRFFHGDPLFWLVACSHLPRNRWSNPEESTTGASEASETAREGATSEEASEAAGEAGEPAAAPWLLQYVPESKERLGGCGCSKFDHQGTADFSPRFHYPGVHFGSFGYPFYPCDGTRCSMQVATYVASAGVKRAIRLMMKVLYLAG